MKKSIFNNTELLHRVSTAFDVVIYQDTNYSDQSEKFYRFNVCRDKNAPVMGVIIFCDGEFKASATRMFDGSYTTMPILAEVAQFMNNK